MRDEDNNKATQASNSSLSGMGMAAGRQSTKAMLLAKAEHMRKEAHQLEALAYALGNLSGEAEEILYRLIQAHIYR